MTVTKEQVDEFVKVVREFGDGSMSAEVIVALADQRAELAVQRDDAEREATRVSDQRAELVALVKEWARRDSGGSARAYLASIGVTP